MPKGFFPDKTPMDDWFFDVPETKNENLGKRYVVTDYGIADDGKVYTEKFQGLIDDISANGGGVLVVPAGTFYTGALFLKSGVDLYIEKEGVLKGSDDISDYPVCTTRIEGQTCKYFPALINADNVDRLTICGEGTIDGNGEKSWKAFWIRRKWNPDCTNKDEQRPRLIYISNSTNVTVSGLSLQNSHFWTNHFYKCRFVKFIDCRVFSPFTPVPAPSTDAIDIDACTDMLIHGCYFHVNDDAIALKGGKGPDADKMPDNGANERIVIRNCEFGFCHSCLTCGSESIHNRNICLENITIGGAHRLLWLKMRPDTPQHYEYITVSGAKGRVNEFINANPWTQFYDMKGAAGVPLSHADNVTVRDCELYCDKYLNVSKEDSQYILSDFTFENLIVRTRDDVIRKDAIRNLTENNVTVESVVLGVKE